jgi:ribose transport system substrate-binding protein
MDNGIPVVTVMSDCEESSRTSFVNLNNVDLGKEYGRQLAKLRGEKGTISLKAVILLDNDTKNSDDTVYRSIMAYLNGSTISLSSYTVDTSTPFATEENIMKKLDELDRQNNIPDVIICLNDRTTESTIQCIVEKNLVGKTTVLGYYDSEPILKSIEKGSVYATFAVEANTIAKQCINTLNEYNDTGNVSNYMTAGFIKIDKTNVATYDPEGDRNEG